MRPADFPTVFGEAAERRIFSRPHLGLALSVALHGIILLLGLIVWNLPGKEGGPAGGGGSGGAGCVMVDLGCLPMGASHGTPEATEQSVHDDEGNTVSQTPPEERDAVQIAADKAAVVPTRTTSATAEPDKRADKRAGKRASAGSQKAQDIKISRDAEKASSSSGEGSSSQIAQTPGPSGQEGHPGPPGLASGTGTGEAQAASGADGHGSHGIGTGGGGILSLGEVDAKPKLIRHVEPDYPESARKRALSGKVMARFVVDESGIVHEPAVFSSDPPGVFDDSVIEAVRRWKFEPARHKGKAVKVVVTVPVRFNIAQR